MVRRTQYHSLERLSSGDSGSPRKMGHISGKAYIKGDIYFDGCYEETCHKGDYYGYGCHAGHCAYICHPKGCYEAHAYSQTSGESWGQQEGYGKRFEKGGSKGQSHLSNTVVL
ncbi:unnamed protein product [Dibothriocephalus latus]|uniref:Uncharacterized protein n=1 Tax=Dibothriocephalus latus TaxID=60516 RepID=A0A3P6U1C2_DIBLA|nr:unnamed protein product [Dibothriocephalus latus]